MKTIGLAVLLAVVAPVVACSGSGGAGDPGAGDPAAEADVAVAETPQEVAGDVAAPDVAAADTFEAKDAAIVDTSWEGSTEAVVIPHPDATDGSGPDTPADVAPDAPASPCGLGGACVEAGQACPAAWMVMTQMGCTTSSGSATGSCCVPGGECKTDDDCAGCKLCDLPEAGPYACVDPFTGGGQQCTTKLDCPDNYCCSYTRFADKPLCGGMCVYDDGTADCHFCMPEGMEVSGDTEKCCSGLEEIPMPMMAGDSCIPSRCFCSTCVKHCGDGVCSTGETPCTCPADCPHSFAKGPGSPCASDADCATPGGCLTEASGYPAGGYCTGGPCDTGSAMDLCPPGSTCMGTWFAEALLCMPTCRKDGDCREGLTCEAAPQPYAKAGVYTCWQAGGTQLAGLGQACGKDGDCISGMCLAATGGSMVCSAFCDSTTPCKQGQTCKPMGGCGAPGCGACFAS